MIKLKASTGLVALLGYPVEHSLSPVMQNAAFAATGLDLVYLAFAVSPVALPAALQGLRVLGFRGANVTVPHKEAIIKHLDTLDHLSERIGAVNTVVNSDGCLKGYNTDASGFLNSLEEHGFTPGGKRVVILGAGGAARAVAFTLADAGCARLTIANRDLERARALATALAGFGLPLTVFGLETAGLRSELAEAHLVVNATSMGMRPHTGATPLPADWLQAGQWVYDLVYNPLETRLLMEARQRGCRTVTGLSMLLYQGVEAFKLWTGQSAPVGVMRRALQRAIEN